MPGQQDPSSDASLLPHKSGVMALNGFTSFTALQSAIEGAVRPGVHNAVGGDMATAVSPSDPLFWLHHGNIDRSAVSNTDCKSVTIGR